MEKELEYFFVDAHPCDEYYSLLEKKNSIFRAIMQDNKIATAFLMQLPQQQPFCGMCGLVTNNHVFDKLNLVPTAQITLEYQGDQKQNVKFTIGNNRYTFTSPKEGGMDATFIEIQKDDIPAIYKPIFVHPCTPPIDLKNDVFLVQLYGGKEPSLSVGKKKSMKGHIIEHTAAQLP